jgi:hypothetical protein
MPKKIAFTLFFKLETSNNNYIIQNESICIYKNFHMNQFFTQLSLVLFQFSFKIFVFLHKTFLNGSLVCWNILKMNVQCTAMKNPCSDRNNPNRPPSYHMTQSMVNLVFIFLELPSGYQFTT